MIQKLIILLTFCPVFNLSVYSQSSSEKLAIDSSSEKIKDFKYALNKQFTKITTGTAFGNLGNFAAISSDSKSFAIGGSLISKEAIWAFELAGGATEGILKLFSNEELNSNFSGELKYHKRTKTYFGARDHFEEAEINHQINALSVQFAQDSLALVNQKELYKLRSDKISSAAKILELRSQISKLEKVLEEKPISKEKEDSLSAKKGLLLFEIENEKLNVDTWNRQLNLIGPNPEIYFDTELEKKAQTKDRKWGELIEKRKSIELQGFDFQWISLGLKMTNNSFKLFNPGNLPESQFTDTSFVSQMFTASISRYRSTSFQTSDVYWSTGFTLGYSSNFNALKKVEIEERAPVSGNPQQQIRKTINAYQGNYKEGSVAFSLFYDYYRFFGQFNSMVGIHFNPTMSYNSSSKKPLTNAQFGIIIPFASKEKQTSKLNVEIFYNKQDIFNYLGKKIKDSFWGIRATLPITIVNYKQ